MKALGCAALALLLAGCLHDEERNVEPTPFDAGGATTLREGSSNAFAQPAPNLTRAELDRHRLGDAAFEATFVTGEAPVNGGLGPLFNNTSCIACHAKDGRGKPPAPGEPFASLLLRVSLPGRDEYGGPRPVPGFGGQLQPRAVHAIEPEAVYDRTTVDSLVVYADGKTVTLKVPRYTRVSSYAPMPSDMLLSPRIAPPVFGLGLLEAVPEAAILAQADPDDRDRDGISGRPNWVHDALTGKTALGRFGWKANTPNLTQQNAAAYLNDMGIRNPVFGSEGCGTPLPHCDEPDPEIDSATLSNVTFYVQTLAVPARRAADGEIRRGERLFRHLRCDRCHVPGLESAADAPVRAVAGQRFAPYTDLLLHDMGPALADGRPDFEASGSEWRTAPLWGIGLTALVNGHTSFLHDGRARTLEEAVLWHGGEAEASRRGYQDLSSDGRSALLAFLNSL